MQGSLAPIHFSELPVPHFLYPVGHVPSDKESERFMTDNYLNVDDDKLTTEVQDLFINPFHKFRTFAE